MKQSQVHPMTEQLEPRQLFDMTYAPFMFNALDAAGAPIANGTYVMALDLDGNGWQGNSYTAQSSGAANASSWLWDTNDMLMDRGQVVNGEAYPFSTISTAQKPATYTANVDHYYILWFDTPYNATAAGPGAGVHYGAEDLGTVGTDPGDYSTFPNGGNASLTTISVLDSVPPTAGLANPANGATISDTTLNARGYIDVTFGDTGGSGLNLSTITDAGAEFTLGGGAASGVTVNGAATLVSGTTYRYTFTGAFGDGAVTVNFTVGGVADGQGNLIAGSSQGFTVADVAAPTVALASPVEGANIGDATLNARGYIDVTFGDGGSSGLNLSTITDAGAEFTLGGAAASGVTVNGAPTLVSGTTYRYTFTGTFTPGAVTVDFVAGSVADNAGNSIAAASQGFTVAVEDAVPPTAGLADPADGATISDTTLNARGYIDVTFGDTGGSELNLSTITDAGAEFTLDGAAASGVTVNGAPMLVSGTTYRYTFTGAFGDGTVTVNFAAGGVADGQGNLIAGSSQGFTVADVAAPTVALASPADGANIGDKTLNSHGYIDVTFADGGSSALNLSTITDAGAEFTLGGAAASGVTVNGAPTLVSGTTYRYTFTGTFTPGAVTVDFVAGSVADNAANLIVAASQGFTVFDQDIVPPMAVLADPADGATIDDTTLNSRGYIDVTFGDTGGSGLNASTITDFGAEFALSGAAADGVTVDGAGVLVSGTTYRYSFTGAFTGGLVTVNFLAGGVADAQGNLIAGSSQSFTVHLVDTTKPTADLANPANGASVVDVALNAQGYIDVTFTDAGGSGLNLATITDAGTEFTLNGAAASGVTVDGAATLVSGTTYRYAFTGAFTGGAVSVQFPAGAWADNAGNANAAATEGFDVLHGLPEILVSGKGQEIVSGDTTPSTADDTAFGAVNVGSPVTHTFTIQNTGTIPLNLTGTPRVQVSGTDAADFVVTTQPATASIAGAGSTTFVVRFTPTAPGVRTATITIANNDADEGSYTFDVQGVGGRKLTFGGKTQAQYTDASGDIVTMALKDIGSGEVWFANIAPAVHIDASSIVLTGTGVKSALTTSITGQLKRTTVGDIRVVGPMLQIAGAGLTVNGDILVDGTLGSLTLDTLTGSDVEIRRNGAATADPKAQLALTANVVQDTTLNTHGEPIKSITVWEWTDVDGQANDAIVSSWIGSLTTKGRKALIGGLAGDFEAHLDLAISRDTLSGKPAVLALGSATFAGMLTPGVWQIVGGVGTVKAGAVGAGQLTTGAVKSITTTGDFGPTRWDITGDLGGLTVGGTAHTTLKTTGNMGALSFGAVTGSDFLAGVTTTAAGDPAITRHADNVADLDLLRSIKGVTIKGLKGAAVTTPFFQDSNFSAGSIGAVSLVNVKYDAGTAGAHAADQFGFWGHTIKSVSAKNLANKADTVSWPKVALTAAQVDLSIQPLA